jgi:RHS repeat-associated protein
MPSVLFITPKGDQRRPDMESRPAAARRTRRHWLSRSNTAGDAELPGTTTTYYAGDQIGSTRMMLTAGGWPVSMDTYYPFGVEASPQADQNHYKFTGKERDAETGNDYFGARYYAGTMGRFLSPDWSDTPQAMPYADLSNPQSFNRYVYLNNNPLNGVDPDGHLSASGTPCGGEVGAPQPYQTGRGISPTSPCKSLPVAQQNVSSSAVGKTTVGNLAKTMTNEDGSLSGGAPGSLEKGKTALANAIINNAKLKHPAKVAPDTGTPSTQDAQIMGDAYTNRSNGGADPVQGRTQYGTSHYGDLTDRSASNGLKGAAGRETVFAQFGPFKDSTSRQQTYIYIYDDPGH